MRGPVTGRCLRSLFWAVPRCSFYFLHAFCVFCPRRPPATRRPVRDRYSPGVKDITGIGYPNSLKLLTTHYSLLTTHYYYYYYYYYHYYCHHYYYYYYFYYHYYHY